MILVLGFRPFAGRGVNGSETLVRALDGLEIGGEAIVSDILDVVWGCPEERLNTLLPRYQPALVLGFGEGNWGGIKFERQAVNLAVGQDESGVLQEGDPLDPAGDKVRDSPLPFDPTWFEGQEVPAKESHDAGAYLCNSLLYHGLAPGRPPFGFVHLPVQQAEPEDRYLRKLMPAARILINGIRDAVG